MSSHGGGCGCVDTAAACADFSVVVFAIYHAGHGKDNFRIFHEILNFRAKEEGAARASV